jgi:hypothetical protein
MTSQIKTLASKWEYWKAKEAEAVAQRREAEDELAKHLGIDATVDGSKTHKPEDGLKITVTTRLNHKINSDELQALAAELGLTQHLGHLFAWRPSINAKAWKAADESITAALAPAITTTAGRPSFKIKFD